MGSSTTADLGAVPLGVGADSADVGVGQVLAFLAKHDVVLDGVDSVGKLESLLVGKLDDVVGQPLGALGADAGQLGQLLDEAGQGRCGGWQAFGSHGRAVMALPELLPRLS